MISRRRAWIRTASTGPANHARPATATIASATSPSPSPFDRWQVDRWRGAARLATLLALAATACADEGEARSDVVATIAGEGQRLSLERAVVEQLMSERGLDADAARELGLARLRLVAARRAELAAREQPPVHADELDPARRRRLERAAMVRLWLDEVFEAEHGARDIPQRVIDQNMANPSLHNRLFHPEILFVCQALLVPMAKGEDGRHVEPPSEGEEAAAWRAAASEAFSGLVRRVERVAPDLLADADCTLLGRIVGVSERSFETEAGPMTIRFERFGFAPSEPETFDPTWVEAVVAGSGPRIIGPFATRFGLHLVVVSKIIEAQLPDDAIADADALREAREELLRGEIEQTWRAEQLQRALAELRDRRVVRLSQELERGPGP